MDTEYTIRKTLTRNDAGETGSHMAGMHVPKEKEILSFFPDLTSRVKNPRYQLSFTDKSGCNWEFTFIYYNNKLFGGTRNEYRLTGMTRFIKNSNLSAGDTILLSKTRQGKYFINYSRIEKEIDITDEVLKLSNRWKVVKI